MKFTINSTSFSNVINAALRVIPKGSLMPILDNVLLEAEGESVCVTASDSQSTLRVTVKGTGGLRVDRPGRACVPAKIFAEILSTLSCDKVSHSRLKTGSMPQG